MYVKFQQTLALQFVVLKGLIRLVLTDLQELQETAHTKSYITDTSTKYRGSLLITFFWGKGKTVISEIRDKRGVF